MTAAAADMSMNFTNHTTDELFRVSPALITLLSILYGTISVVTIIGNALIIIVLAKNRAMHTVTNFFIANLSVADVIVGFFSIPFQFQAALLQRWDLPEILCPVAPFVKEMSVNVSVFTLVVISVDRFFAVIHPLRQLFTRKAAEIVMVVVWLLGIFSSVPTAIAFRVIMTDIEEGGGGGNGEVENEEGIGMTEGYITETDSVAAGRRPQKPFCYPLFPSVQGLDLGPLYRMYLSLVQYFFPLAIISYAYIRIIHRIWLSKAPGTAMDARDQLMHKNKKKVIKMLIIVVGLFAFCWLPLQTYNLLSEICPQINEYRFINIVWFCSNWLAMSNSCYNPFIYGLLNEKFKRGFERLFRHCSSSSSPSSSYSYRQASPGLERASDGESVRVNGGGGAVSGGHKTLCSSPSVGRGQSFYLEQRSTQQHDRR